MKIRNIIGYEVLNSRGIPTIACEIILENGAIFSSTVPSGKSCGPYEALELRDNDLLRFNGKGTLHACNIINEQLAPLIIGKEPDFHTIDQLLLKLDGTINKSILGANTTLALSMAVCKAEAYQKNLPLFKLIAGLINNNKFSYPKIMCNVINGGLHADNNLVFQEFLIIPIGSSSYSESLNVVMNVYEALRVKLIEQGYQTQVGDEGGFAPLFKKDVLPEICALNLLIQSRDAAGYTKNDLAIGIDAAASSWYDVVQKKYLFHGKLLSSKELIGFYAALSNEYDLYSLEDGFAPEDTEGWYEFMQQCNQKLYIVADDLTASSSQRIEEAIDKKYSNAVIIKPNQIGTVSEILSSMSYCIKHDIPMIVSHRSGDTCDSFIADLAIGGGASFIKAGAPIRSEHTSKYNRLLKIQLSEK